MQDLLKKYYDLKLSRYVQKEMYNPQVAAQFALQDLLNQCKNSSNPEQFVQMEIEDIEKAMVA